MKLAALLLFLMTSPALAIGLYPPTLYTVPARPNTWEPTELHFETWCLVQDPAQPILRREGRLLQVGVIGGGCVTSYPPPKDIPFSISAGLLEAGTYTVELWLVDEITSDYFSRQASFVIEVLQPPAPLTDPQKPVDTLPVRVVLSHVGYGGYHYEAMTRRSGSTTIQVEVSGPPCFIICEPSFLPVDLGRLEAGTYFLEWIDSDRVLGIFTLMVAAGPRLSFEPAAPIENEAVRLRVVTPGHCPTAAPPTRIGDRFELALEDGACVPPYSDGELDVALPPLPAGTYKIEVLTNGQPAARAALEVLPAAATLGQGRFQVAASWRSRGAETGNARLAAAPTADSALYYFFSPNNWELMVKVLDGCAINGHHWVFAAASTDVEYSVTITDVLAEGRTFHFGNTPGQPAAAVTNINAFPCLEGLR